MIVTIYQRNSFVTDYRRNICNNLPTDLLLSDKITDGCYDSLRNNMPLLNPQKAKQKLYIPNLEFTTKQH